MLDDSFLTLPFSTSESFRNTASICHDVIPWQKETSSTGFEIPSISDPITQWSGEIQMPELFLSETKGSEPKLTNAKLGLFRQTTELNLSELAAFLVETHDFMAIGEELAIYRKPCWRILSRHEILREISMRLVDFGGSYLSSYQLQEIRKRILNSAKVHHLAALPASDYRILCCRDALYRWSDDTIIPPKRKYHRFNHLEVSANDIFPSETPFFDRLVETAAQGDIGLVQRLLECLGVIFTGYPCKQFFVFEGPSDSGKSQLAHFIQEILGATSCFAVNDIEQFSTRFLTGMLPGKLLCICSDVSDKPLTPKAVGLIKQLTGGDLIFGERKYRDADVFQNTSKLLFLTNFPLQISGSKVDTAFQRRLLKIPFRYSVPEHQQIPDLYKRLVNEAGGIIWKALQALVEFDARGGIFTQLDNPDDVHPLEVVPTSRDYITIFINTCCLLDPNVTISVEKLYRAFLQFLQKQTESVDPPPASAFSRILFSLGFPIGPVRTAKERKYAGIQLLPNWENILFIGGDCCGL